MNILEELEFLKHKRAATEYRIMFKTRAGEPLTEKEEIYRFLYLPEWVE